MIDLTLGQGNAEDMNAAAALGYNLMDVTSASSLSSFPPGTQGVAYIPNCDGATAENQSLVMEYAGQPNFWGFFIFDEPTTENCPPANMKAIADFIRANASGAKTYTVLGEYEGSGEYAAALDYVGINPYPCRDGGCDMNVISDYVNEFASNGVPKEKMTPVFQGFSGDGWVLPTAAQMQEIQSIWAQIIPNPQVENTYVWAWSGGQGLRDTPELQAVMKAHNTGHAVPQ
jgi:hypothetical protein